MSGDITNFVSGFSSNQNWNYWNGSSCVPQPIGGTYLTCTGERWQFCPKCGKKLEATWNHCPGCGVAVGTMSAWQWVPVYQPYQITWTVGNATGSES